MRRSSILELRTISAVAAVAAGLAGSASAGDWAAYRSGLVNAGPDSNWQPAWPYYQYEDFAVSNGSMSGGTLSQTVTTDPNQRAVWYSFGYNSGDVVQALGNAPATVGNLGLTSLSASVTVSGSALQLVTGAIANGSGPNGSDALTSTTTGVSMAWYVEAFVGGQYSIWLSNAANRLSLNSILNGSATNFSVALNAANFQSFPASPQGSLSFADTLANARSFGLLITTATASGADFTGMKFDQWVNANPSGWTPYAIQRNGNYGAYSTGSTTITIGNAIPAPGAIALLGTAGLLGSRRRRS